MMVMMRCGFCSVVSACGVFLLTQQQPTIDERIGVLADEETNQKASNQQTKKGQPRNQQQQQQKQDHGTEWTRTVVVRSLSAVRYVIATCTMKQGGQESASLRAVVVSARAPTSPPSIYRINKARGNARSSFSYYRSWKNNRAL